MRAGEFANSKLVIFDIDDTLVNTDTRVDVRRGGRVVKSLNSHDFTHYDLQPGEEFDFGRFRDAREFFTQARPIPGMIRQLKQDIATGNRVIMLTARSDFNDRDIFLDTFRRFGIDMDRVHVYRAGNLAIKAATEEKKKIVLKHLLGKEHYDKVVMYDDSVPNLNAFLSLSQDYPWSQFYAWHVDREGRATEYHRTGTGLKEGIEHYQGLDITMSQEDDEIMITAYAGGKELGHVLFVDSDGYLMPQDLEVNERFRGQGIAKTMYDYAKSKGYKIRRSGQQTDAGAGFWDKYRPGENVWESKIQEVNAPGELSIDNDLIDRFTNAGWQIDGEGRDQIVMSKPGSNLVLKIVGYGSLPRQAEIRRYVTFFRAYQRNPHFPRVGPDRTLKWKGRTYYAYTQERLYSLPGDEAVMDYLEYAMGELGHGEEPDYNQVPPGLTVEQIDGLVMAVDSLFASGVVSQRGFDLGNVANIMQRANGQLVIVDPASSFDDELSENFADGKVRGKSRPGRVKRAGASCKGSVTDLRARAQKYGGERGRMYHWCANMKSGKNK